MFSTGTWVNSGTTSITGLDDIDLWVGGLAERTNLFGGLLGSTFNYVFENQLTNLQNGDRFYYLARTPGMNLRAQLEGNSFAELVTRNTNAHTLKADPFATADCKFELGHLTWPAVSGSFITGAGSVNDDPLSECNENRLLLRMPDGTIRYRMINSVDPSGINGQAVYNGAPGAAVDRIYGGNDSDTFWGGLGNDIIEGGDGADVALGGEGNDIITDLAGDDVPKGGPGNDAIDAGPGLDILMGGDGKDFMNGGANSNEHFGGSGDDFVIGGQGIDGVFGDSGNDWVEGGDQPDLLIGDSSTLFFTDFNLPGHDILIGQGGDDDYDGEGGDDIFVAGPGVEKNAGAAGYDWSIGLGDPQPQNADLNLKIVPGQPPVNEVRDKFNELEALSGWNLNDILIGDDIVPTAVGGGGFIGCDALDAAGVARIAGLGALVPASIRTVNSADLVAASATNFCLLTGLVWGDGNILLGGAGSDTLEGRGANDILDGDRYLNVRLSIRTSLGVEIGTTDLMERAAVLGNFGPGTTGMTLQQAVFAGLVDPGNIAAVREILNPGPGTDVDVAQFSGPLAEYDITFNTTGDLAGSVTVAHTRPGGGGGGGGGAGDGIDTLWNVEQLSFCDVPGALPGTCDLRAPLMTIGAAAQVGPASLAFGSVTSGTTSASQPVTVTNTGSAPLLVGVVSLTGANPTQFTVTGNTCTIVAPAGFCTINVAFAPTAVGAAAATLSIAHNAAGSPSLVTLTGTGLASTLTTFSVPASLNFGTKRILTNTTKTVLVTNTGANPLFITSATAAAPFANVTLGTCSTPVAVGRTCKLNVTFTPTSATAFVGALTVVSSNATNSPQTVALTGTGR
jgi:Ca2+-binding RTX toxin-like protein